MTLKEEIYTAGTGFYIFIICLSIFILGVQLGIKHGRALEREDIQNYYGYEITN